MSTRIRAYARLINKTEDYYLILCLIQLYNNCLSAMICVHLGTPWAKSQSPPSPHWVKETIFFPLLWWSPWENDSVAKLYEHSSLEALRIFVPIDTYHSYRLPSNETCDHAAGRVLGLNPSRSPWPATPVTSTSRWVLSALQSTPYGKMQLGKWLYGATIALNPIRMSKCFWKFLSWAEIFLHWYKVIGNVVFTRQIGHNFNNGG